MKKYKILILAEAANPEWTSVPLIGWSFTQALSECHDVHLVTHVRNKGAIEKFGWKEGIQFTSIDNEFIAKPAYKFALFLRGGNTVAWTITTAISSIIYPIFEYMCWRKFKDRLKKGEYDLVHRITPVSPTTPSYIANKLKRIGVPFVVGPINGGVEWPKEFEDLRKKEKEWLVKLKFLANFLPGRNSLYRNASALVCGSRATQQQLPSETEDKQIYIPENAISTDRFSKVSTSEFQKPLKAVFVGRLVPYKGAQMAVEAMHDLAKKNQITFDIFGSGPEESSLDTYIRANSLEKNIRLRGFVPNDQLQNELLESDILVFPSIREFGGGVVLEAMALGIVPIIVDYAGPSELVNDAVGYKVPLSERQSLIDCLRDILSKLAMNRSELKLKRQKCVEKIQNHYTWQAKVKQITQVYNWVTFEDEKKPDIKFN